MVTIPSERFTLSGAYASFSYTIRSPRSIVKMINERSLKSLSERRGLHHFGAPQLHRTDRPFQPYYFVDEVSTGIYPAAILLTNLAGLGRSFEPGPINFLNKTMLTISYSAFMRLNYEQ